MRDPLVLSLVMIAIFVLCAKGAERLGGILARRYKRK